jgi:hypothetical protein
VPDTDTRAHEVQAVVALIRPLLAGRAAEVQDLVLVDLLATFLAGHHPGLRETILELHIKAVRGLVEINEKIMFGEHGHPGRIEGGDR